ncbi:PIN domain-containing protein (plasmid) [Nostoc sp. UHCC 0870]|uniref:PIN domain-containing protein n=1 Tax=Nostoc sp. UHCC 0870 TaxID=2914041 RepID=UPI001EDF0B7A|nr:PIN domain-containing protein [Nostoc sp. UHCC 0870]UKP01400.1 PIN domain-containing protein [Nostoc sp. UHCC 0870]
MTQEIASFPKKTWETPLHLCLDLNIWCAALLADRKGKQGTASQILVEIVKQGFCNLGPVQLVISWGMLNRLRWVLEKDFSIPQSTADLYIDAIRGYAEHGAYGASPQLSLGGTGVIALQDREDAHVLETALAGRAAVLVTANFKDFISTKDAHIILPQQHANHSTPAHAIYFSPAHKFHIANTAQMMFWLKSGQIPEI